MSIEGEVQSNQPSEYVELFDVDLTPIGGSVYHFTQNKYESSSVIFDGVTYVPFDMVADGFEWDSQGELPQPKIKISSSTEIVALINTYNDILGSRITRTRTFRKFLDGQPAADPTSYLQKDVYYINQKTMENKYYVEFTLNSYMDQQGMMLPKGKLVPYCRARYRKWNGTTFDYDTTDLACPYTAATYFKEDGTSTLLPAEDACPHNDDGCKARFGTGTLPLMGFPGLQKPTA